MREFNEQERKFINLILENGKDINGANLCKITDTVLGDIIDITCTSKKYSHEQKLNFYIKTDSPKYLTELSIYYATILKLIKYLIQNDFIIRIGNNEYTKPEVRHDPIEQIVVSSRNTSTIIEINNSYAEINNNYYYSGYTYTENLVQLKKNKYTSEPIYHMRKQSQRFWWSLGISIIAVLISFFANYDKIISKKVNPNITNSMKKEKTIQTQSSNVIKK